MTLIPQFANPHMLWLALLVPPLIWWMQRRVTTAAVRYPSVRHLRRLPRSFRQRARIALPILRGVALLLIVVVLARPIRQLETQQLPSQGIAIAMLLDRSGSMGDPDNRLMYNDQLTSRFDAAKDVFERFVSGDRKDLTGRPNDLVGLFTFAKYPRTDYPFSLDHAAVVNMVKQMSFEKNFIDKYGRSTNEQREAVDYNPMNATDIKKAIEYAANKLSVLGDDLARTTPGMAKYDLKSKVMLILTDNEPTVRDRGQGPSYPDEDTVKLLIDSGIKVYFVQLLAQQIYRERPDGTVEVLVPTRGPVAEIVNRSIEEARKLARRTGGQHYLATNGDQLKGVYEEINRLERSDVGVRAQFNRDERYGGFLLSAILLLAAETILGVTYFRRSP
jgi:Ca-activated chloride channel homolog